MHMVSNYVSTTIVATYYGFFFESILTMSMILRDYGPLRDPKLARGQASRGLLARPAPAACVRMRHPLTVMRHPLSGRL